MTHADTPCGEPLAEQLHDVAGGCLAEAVVDRGAALVRNVALLGPQSRNGYRYTREAMREAAPLYRDRPVFIDHPDAAPTQRKLRDYAGQVVNPRFEGDRLRGDLRLLGPNTDWLLGLVEAAPSDIGMSHVVLARRDPAGEEVRRIEAVLSVDVVAFPATTQSFREGAAPDRPTGPPPPAAAAAERGRPRPPSVPTDRLDALVQLVEQSRIPALGRSARLHRLLLLAPDPRALLAAVEELWDDLAAEAPRSPERTAEPPAAVSPAARRALVAAVRGR
jgi:hypothetical protein